MNVSAVRRDNPCPRPLAFRFRYGLRLRHSGGRPEVVSVAERVLTNLGICQAAPTKVVLVGLRSVAAGGFKAQFAGAG